MDPLIGTIVVASAPEVDNGMSTDMSTRGAKRQRHLEQEDDNQSNVTFEGIDVVYDFGLIIPIPSDNVDPMEADLHSRGSDNFRMNTSMVDTVPLIIWLL
jgi:hypothetical protein